MLPRLTLQFFFILFFATKAFAQGDSHYHFFYLEPTYDNCHEPHQKYSSGLGLSFGFEFIHTYKKGWGTEWGFEFSGFGFRSPNYQGYLSIDPHNTYYNYGYGNGPPVPMVNVNNDYFFSLLEFPFLVRKEWAIKSLPFFISAGPAFSFGREHIVYNNPGYQSQEEKFLVAMLRFQTIVGCNLKVGSYKNIRLAVKGDLAFVSKDVDYDSRKKEMYSLGLQLTFPFTITYRKKQLDPKSLSE
jgi:hypothetical protein